jgi:hypothetical protein
MVGCKTQEVPKNHKLYCVFQYDANWWGVFEYQEEVSQSGGR